MRQLDLFGMPIGDEPEEKAAKQEEMKKQDAGTGGKAVSENAELGAEDEFVAEVDSGTDNALAGTEITAAGDELIAVDKIEVVASEAGTGTGSEAPPVVVAEKKAEKAVSERSSSIVFDDGKISVKIKAKPQPVVELVKEKLRKEPQKRGRKSFREIDAEVDLIELPDDEALFSKQYYAISEVARWFRVNTSLIRFWENEFDVLKPKKNRKGDRLFRPEDVKNLQLIYQLLRQRKYTIEGAKEFMKNNKKKADLQLQLTQTLNRFKGFLLDLKANLQ